MCEEESDDSEAVAKLLEINDSIHRTIERYKLMKAGDIAAATKIPKGTLGTTTGVGKNAANELSLIDFDPEPTASPPSNGDIFSSSPDAGKPTTIEDDLLGLSIDNKPFGQMGGIALRSGSPAPTTPSLNPKLSAPGHGQTLMQNPSPMPQPSQPNYDIFASLARPQSTAKPATPPPTSQRTNMSPQPSRAVDPFAALVSSSSRPSTPSQRVNGSRGTTDASGLGDFGQKPTASSKAVTTTTEDEWNFASALPEVTLLASNTVQVHASLIKILFRARRPSGQEPIHITVVFSNDTSQTVTGVHFQLAVQKGYNLQLRPQSGRDMGPNQQNAIQQEVVLSGVPPGSGNSVNMRFKVSYLTNSQPREEQGMVPPLGIS